MGEDQQPNPLKPLLAVVGATGSGKSDLALRLAEEFSGEIVNFDSVQVYRGLDVGSAKTPVAERRGIPHHLLDVIEPREELTAGSYARLAREALQNVSERGRIPILVGGTGFYLRAVLDGLSPAPLRDVELRDRLEKIAARRPGALHRFLETRDPGAAERIHPNDHQKLIRAIELAAVACDSPPLRTLPRDGLRGYATLKIGVLPQRAALHARINRRVLSMFEQGVLEETNRLMEQGLTRTDKPLLALGYKQSAGYLTGSLNRDEAVAECQARTRQYAKRQLTWFRADPSVHWLHGFGDEQAVIQDAVALTREWLKGFTAE